MKHSKILILAFFTVMLTSCVSFKVAIMTSSNMTKLELGMTKNQVVNILGSGYTIAEKRIEDNKVLEVLSYRDHYRPDEIYMFVFKNNGLDRWYRVLVPQESMKTIIQESQK